MRFPCHEARSARRTKPAPKTYETMKRAITWAVVAAVAASCFGCKAFRTLGEQRINAQGAPYELIVVCDQPEWQGALGDTLRSILTEPVAGLNQREPHFDVLRVLPGRLRESRHAPPQRAAGARRRRSRGARGGRAVRPLRPAADRHDVAGAHAAVARRLPERAPRRTALRAGEGRARPHDRIRPQVPRQVPRGAGQGAVRRRFRRAAGLQTPREGRRLPVGLLRIPAGQSGILHLLLPLHGPAGTDGPRRLRRRATASPPASRAPPRALT